MRSSLFGLISAGAVASFLAPACSINVTPSGGDYTPPEIGADFDAAIPRGVGERCDDGSVCRTGLVCDEGVCKPGRSSEQGTPCVISAECQDGLYCGPERTCAPAGSGEQGAACASDGDCKSGLRCNIVGLETACQPEGTGDVGDACSASGDCYGGLLCAEEVCVPPPPGGTPPLGIPKFKGVECDDEPGPVTAYFRVPRGKDDKDFFRLPYPNDIRRKSGQLDLTGFPTPGADLLGFDLVDRWARFLERTGTGYSVYPTVTFRFSGEVDFESLKQKGAVRWIDITEGEERDLGYGWSASTGRTAYVCPNHMSFRPPTGAPLEPGHTYAIVLTNAAKAKDGSAVAVSEDLTALLGSTAPSGALGAAYAAYAPLRQWAAKTSFNLGTLINAAVFTVGKHDELAKKLASAVAAADAPTATGWVKCGGASPSPCADATEARACPTTEDPAFDELHALVTLPRFQKGKLPFLEPADGGDLVLNADGQPTPQGTAEVCMSLTLPKGTMPTDGWPLVVYAHGTGGSFRSHVTEGIAARLANVDGTTKIAVLGIDQVGHGTRRGASNAEPQSIFFNLVNPDAARGNVLQGAADQMALIRFAKGLSVDAGSSPTGAAFTFDRIAFWGHSQGATEGSIAMPYTTDVEGVLFSGVGASLLDSLLTKKSPVNLQAIGPVILSEMPQHVNGVHPALAMFQNAIDPADPLDHAASILGDGALAKHVFVPYGQGDTYSTPITQLTYIAAAGLGEAAPPSSVATPDDLRRSPLATPIGGNSAGITAIVRQYAPSSYDGHFVVFRDANAKVDADRFLADAVKGIVPQIGR